MLHYSATLASAMRWQYSSQDMAQRIRSNSAVSLLASSSVNKKWSHASPTKLFEELRSARTTPTQTLATNSGVVFGRAQPPPREGTSHKRGRARTDRKKNKNISFSGPLNDQECLHLRCADGRSVGVRHIAHFLISRSYQFTSGAIVATQVAQQL